MSCLPGTPCYTNTITTIGGTTSTGCGVDPCILIKLGTDSVFYTGPTLPCSGVTTCDPLTVALQKIDAILCNPPALSITANNGLTKTGNNVQLGGTLVQQTTITTSFAYSLIIAGLVNNVTPTYFVTQKSDGTLTQTTASSITSIILSNVTVNNGLTMTGSLIQLSGPLIKPTTVTTDSTNTLSLAGLVVNTTPSYLITESSTGTLTKTLYSSLLPILADNGLTKTSNKIQLGGPLVIPTNITTDPVNTLSISGLSTDASPLYFITQDSSNVVKRISSSSLTTNISSQITANNGLNKSSSTNVRLGGTLITPTTIVTDATNTLSITGLQTDTNPDYIVTESTAGVVRRIAQGSLGTLLGSAITANNGLTKTSNNIQLGGTLLNNTTVNTDAYSMIFTANDTLKYNTATFNSGASVLQTGDVITSVPSGSYTRLITFRSSAALWLTNYTSPAYNAQVNWIAAHPWITFTASHNFQVVDTIHAVNKTGAFIARYYDERVGNINWQDTWSSSSATGWPGWISGKTYTLRTKEVGDNFPAGMASLTRSGTPNTVGWVFVSNGTSPTTWTNGSLVDGDYPVVDLAQQASRVVCDTDLSGNGRVKIDGIDTLFTTSIDQRLATRGIMPAHWATADRPSVPNEGEMGYNTSLHQMEYWNGSTWIQF